MHKQIEQLKVFMHSFGQEVPTKPTLADVNVTELRLKLHEEEAVRELHDAYYREGSLTAVADSIVDSLYVVIGTALAFGLQDVLEDAFDAVHHRNMAKFWTTSQVEEAFLLKTGDLDHKVACQNHKMWARRTDAMALWIVTDEHAKVVKPLGFTEPDLKTIVER